MRTWLDDDDPALAKTMARLDRELRRGERVIEGAEDFRRLSAPLRAVGRALMQGRGPRAGRRAAATRATATRTIRRQRSEKRGQGA